MSQSRPQLFPVFQSLILEILEIPKVNTNLSEKQGLIKDKIDFAELFRIVFVDLIRVRISIR
jgi:hypothetical protein